MNTSSLVGRAQGRAGQAAVEFLLVACVIVAMVAILAVLLYTTREQGGRVLDLVGADAP